MAKPLIPADKIYEHALALLDEEGATALSTRRLAADLKISTRTLYQQVGNRENLIHALVARHLSRLRLDFHQYEDWESTALHWCLGLHDALRAHPNLTELMTIDDADAVMGYVNELVAATRREGLEPRLAEECCRALVVLTINHTIMEVRGIQNANLSERDPESTDRTEANFVRSVGWVLAGVRAEASSSSTGTTTAKRGSSRSRPATRTFDRQQRSVEA
ncbi:TetR family transcriptional regulator [Gordonia sp. CPCC 206044]|uniref:TetR/AcrR family transcriptional regulator n=1 Tax=Gordonia sp. CPCC 206044 TaxID=3140793 RepID=UPI003AF3B2D3